jgi:hypothetical protein
MEKEFSIGLEENTTANGQRIERMEKEQQRTRMVTPTKDPGKTTK